MAGPQVSIIIPTHNEGRWLQRTVDAVLSATCYEHYQILVVDDGSTDGSSDFLSGYGRNFRHVRCLRTKHRGVAGARALGAEAASGEALVFLDAHVLPAAGWLAEIMDVLKGRNVGLAALSVRSVRNEDLLGHTYFPVNLNLEAGWSRPGAEPVRESPAVTGCCFGVWRDTYWKIGAIDPGSTGWGVNDVELGLRTWYAGYRCLVSNRVQVAHHFKQGGERSFQVSWEDYDVNLLRTAFTYFDGPRLCAILLNAAERPSFQRSLERVQRDGGYWRRRRRLRQGFVRGEDWLFDHFQQELAPLEQDLRTVNRVERGRQVMKIQRDVACPNCGAKNMGIQERCLLCQAELPTSAAARQALAEAQPEPANPRCPHCSEMLAPGVSFCTHCGRSVTA